MEFESDGTLPFLDVLVERKVGLFITSIFRKLTFTGLCPSWNSFVPKAHKTGLVSTLVHRDLTICSPSFLNGELARLKKIFESNGYPTNVIKRIIDGKIILFKEPVVYRTQSMPNLFEVALVRQEVPNAS